MATSGLIPEYSRASGVFTNDKQGKCPFTYRCEKITDPALNLSEPCDYSDKDTSFTFDRATGQLIFYSTNQYNAGYGAGTHNLKIYAKGGSQPDG